MTYIEAHSLALELVKKAGFVLHTVSGQSEACYYWHPHRKPFLLRIATHKSKRSPIGLRGNTVAKATFSPKDPTNFSTIHVENVVAMAIGRYFLNNPPASEYYGKKGTWEQHLAEEGTRGASGVAMPNQASGC